MVLTRRGGSGKTRTSLDASPEGQDGRERKPPGAKRTRAKKELDEKVLLSTLRLPPPVTPLTEGWPRRVQTARVQFGGRRSADALVRSLKTE